MSINRWLYAITTDALVFGCFYLWQIEHVAAAKSFLNFILWTFAILMLIAGFVADKEKKRRGFVFSFYVNVSHIALIGLMVWSGMVAVAITYFIGWLLVQPKIYGPTETA